jgi:hypothetical protein
MSEKPDFGATVERLFREIDWERREGEYARAEDEARRAAVEAEQRATCEALLGQGAPVRALRCARGELHVSAALSAAQEELSAGSVLVALSGAPGLGKTVAALWWLLRARPARANVSRAARFVSAPALARVRRYSDDQMSDLLRARALVIDDLGVEFDDEKGAFRSLLDEVTNARYAAEFPTLITTNLPSKRFVARYGERLVDRIREAGEFVALTGESMRRRR